LNNESETIEFASEFSTSIKPGNCVALCGELGVGKSVFARALMRGLGVTDRAMPSPTFSLIQEYEGKGCRIAHMDWYRLEDADEIDMLGIREYFQAPWIVIIEWPERAPELLPAGARRIQLQYIEDDADAREVIMDE